MSEKVALLPTKRIFTTNAPFKVRNCEVPPDYLYSEISSHALVTIQNIGKT